MTRHQTLLLLLLASVAVAMEMESDSEEYTRPNITNAGSKTFHWLLTLFLQLILPSISTVLVLSQRLHSAVFLQLISLGYTGFDTFFLRFPDGDGVENRTSSGTGWFLLLLSGATVFFGTLNSGTNIIMNQGKSSSLKWVARLSETTVRRIHNVLSVLTVLTGWVKTCLAPVALFGFCREAHTGQCIAHGIMGSAFIWYGFVYVMILVLPYFRNGQIKQSQEFYDSALMLAWGIVNTFTEHRWGREGWSHSDYQHTVSGILWWTGGLLGLFLSRGGRRSFMPALMLIWTGWAMSEHSQKLIISTKVHYMFGLVLIVGGVSRIVEIAFLLSDRRALPNSLINSFQYMPSFCLIEAGALFMGANEEQLVLVLRLGSDHSAYVLLITSAAFMIYLWFLLLLELYLKLTGSGQVDLNEYSSVEGNETRASIEFELDNMDETNNHQA